MAIGGCAHPRYFSASKAHKVSHNTSHSDAMVATVGIAQIICNRFTELDFPIWYWRAPTAKDLLWIEESEKLTMPCDSAIDAMNVFELLTGIKSIPGEKIQR